MRMEHLQRGWAVLGNDGRRLGSIQEVGQNYVLVSRGAFARNLYVPASAIANVDADTVHLNLAKREAEGMGWEQQPRSEDELDTLPESDLHRHV